MTAVAIAVTVVIITTIAVTVEIVITVAVEIGVTDAFITGVAAKCIGGWGGGGRASEHSSVSEINPSRFKPIKPFVYFEDLGKGPVAT